jgi:hypothetical protein
MPTDYKVIEFVPHHFGNEQNTFSDIKPDAVFAGRAKPFTFNCPNVDADERAVLMFQSRDVDSAKNDLHLNGKDIFGGLPVSPNRDTWNGNVMVIGPRQLKATNNVLRIESLNNAGGRDGDIDDFLITNIVIMYKTRSPLPTNQL